jgi:hypothetical protein
MRNRKVKQVLYKGGYQCVVEGRRRGFRRFREGKDD